MNALRLAVFALTLNACNSGQPRIYRVAIDLTPTQPVQDATCYKGGVGPTNTPTSTNLRSEEQWVIWDGSSTDGSAAEFLDSGEQKFTLGNSPAIDFNADIQTNLPGTFVGAYETRVQSGDITQVRDTTISFKFSDEGASPTGTVTLTSAYDCAPADSCPMEDLVPDPRNCSVTVNFTARRLDTARISDDQESPSSSPSSLGSSSSASSSSP